MAEHGSVGRRMWLVLLTASVAAVASLLALLQWGGPALAEGQGIQEQQLERREGDFRQKLEEAAADGGVEPRIVGGSPVPDGRYSFMAVLVIEDRNGSTGLCGGTLIDRDSVLTAGHCLVRARSVDLVVGRTVRSNEAMGRERFATAFYSHPRSNLRKNFAYDAAVLKLNKPVMNIRPIKLATRAQNGLEKPGRRLTVAGWGTTREGGRPTDRMREVSVPVVGDAKARDAYAPTHRKLSYFPKLMVAAGVRGRDACQGDSGGPLFKPSLRTQVGIVSYGLGCARAGFPGVYSEVNNPGIRSFISSAASR